MKEDPQCPPFLRAGELVSVSSAAGLRTSPVSERRSWNRNIHYHDVVLAAVPPACARALDVGCGDGLLASELAARCGEVVAIDVNRPALARASAKYGRPHLTFVEGDVMSHAFEPASFDVIAAIATLHHLPLSQGLERFKQLLRPGGVLTIIGLYRLHAPSDFAYALAAIPVSWWFRCTKDYEEVAAPMRDPDETLAAVTACAARVLPGVSIRRRLLFRYSLVWQKPSD